MQARTKQYIQNDKMDGFQHITYVYTVSVGHWPTFCVESEIYIYLYPYLPTQGSKYEF